MSLSLIKLNLYFESAVINVLWQRTTEEDKLVNRYLADLVVEDARLCQDELAAEGYRLLSEEGLRFVESVLPLAAEVWSVWNQAETSLTGQDMRR